MPATRGILRLNLAVCMLGELELDKDEHARVLCHFHISERGTGPIFM